MAADEHLVSRIAREYALDPSATLAELAQRAGISRATLHRAYGTRDALLTALLHHALDVLEQAAARAGSRDLRALVIALAPHGPHVAVLQHEEDRLASDGELAARAALLLDQIRMATDAAVGRGELVEAPRDFLARLVVDIVWSVWAATQAGELHSPEEWPWRIIASGLSPAAEEG